MNLELTPTKFRALCATAALNYLTLTLAKYFTGKEVPERFAIMRHDIDRRAGRALDAARIEQDI